MKCYIEWREKQEGNIDMIEIAIIVTQLDTHRYIKIHMNMELDAV